MVQNKNNHDTINTKEDNGITTEIQTDVELDHLRVENELAQEYAQHFQRAMQDDMLRMRGIDFATPTYRHEFAEAYATMMTGNGAAFGNATEAERIEHAVMLFNERYDRTVMDRNEKEHGAVSIIPQHDGVDGNQEVHNDWGGTDMEFNGGLNRILDPHVDEENLDDDDPFQYIEVPSPADDTGVNIEANSPTALGLGTFDPTITFTLDADAPHHDLAPETRDAHHQSLH